MASPPCVTACASENIDQNKVTVKPQVKSQYLETRGLEEALAAVLAPVRPLVVVLLPVEDCRVPVGELPPTVLALK